MNVFTSRDAHGRSRPVGDPRVRPLPAGGRASRRNSPLSEQDLLAFEPLGNVTILHLTDIHAQLMPVYFREPSVNLGVGGVAGLPPHVSGADFLNLYGIEPGTPEAYAFTSEDFLSLARTYGKMGGLDRIATIVKQVRAERGEDVLLLDGGDTWQGSYTSLQTKGQDMVDAMNSLSPDAMTGHWEFTYGTERVQEIIDGLPFPFLGSNIFDAEWDEPRVRGLQDVREGRRQDCRHRSGLPLYADREPALDVSQLVVRHPRGGGGEKCRRGPRGGSRHRRAALPQRLRRGSRACRACRRDRCHPHGPHP
jgi:hypothetical protein